MSDQFATCTVLLHSAGVVHSQTTLPTMQCERNSPHLPRVEPVCERGNVCELLVVAGVRIGKEVRRCVCAQGAGKRSKFIACRRLVSVSAVRAGARATNDLYESQQQGAQRHVRDGFSLEQREARLGHRNAENIHRGDNANGAKIPKSNKMETM